IRSLCVSYACRHVPSNIHCPDNELSVLSKVHAAPILYAAWAEAGLFPREELLKLRRIDSDLEGHPTPRLSFVDVATGSLGQGICAAVGTALNARRIKSDYRTYVLLGDGESAEGSVWEAAEAAAHDGLDSSSGSTEETGPRPRWCPRTSQRGRETDRARAGMPAGHQRRRRKGRSERRHTRSATAWRRARRTAPRWPSSATATIGSSRSMATSRTRPSARS